jgi:hypothetical protein
MIFAGLEGLELLMSPLGGEESSKEFEIDPFAIVFVARIEKSIVLPIQHTHIQPVEHWDQQDRDPIYKV